MPDKFKNIAVLIDAENISHNFLEDISENIALYGIVSVRRIYGDWTSEKMKGWKALLLEYAIQPIQQFSNTVGKNSTDSALIIDAMDLLYRLGMGDALTAHAIHQTGKARLRPSRSRRAETARLLHEP